MTVVILKLGRAGAEELMIHILGNLAQHTTEITWCSVITQQSSCDGTEQWRSVKRTEKR